MKFYIEQYSDLVDAFKELRSQRYPYFIVTHNGKRKDQSWMELNAFFHANIVRLFADKTGYSFEEAKMELQKKHALIAETEDSYNVESVGGMSYDRLLKFIEDCQGTLINDFGVMAEPVVQDFKLKKISKR